MHLRYFHTLLTLILAEKDSLSIIKQRHNRLRKKNELLQLQRGKDVPRYSRLNNSRAMEILKDTFEQKLPLVAEAIEKCDFLAIDAEFTGTVLFYA